VRRVGFFGPPATFADVREFHDFVRRIAPRIGQAIVPALPVPARTGETVGAGHGPESLPASQSPRRSRRS